MSHFLLRWLHRRPDMRKPQCFWHLWLPSKQEGRLVNCSRRSLPDVHVQYTVRWRHLAFAEWGRPGRRPRTEVPYNTGGLFPLPAQLHQTWSSVRKELRLNQDPRSWGNSVQLIALLQQVTREYWTTWNGEKSWSCDDQFLYCFGFADRSTWSRESDVTPTDGRVQEKGFPDKVSRSKASIEE